MKFYHYVLGVGFVAHAISSISLAENRCESIFQVDLTSPVTSAPGPMDLAKKYAADHPVAAMKALNDASLYIAQILKSPTGTPADLMGMPKANASQIKDLSELGATALEVQALKVLADQVDKNTLDLFLNLAYDKATKLDPQDQAAVARKKVVLGAISEAIKSTTRLRGMTKDSQGRIYEEWPQYSAKMLDYVRSINEGSFEKNIEKASESKFRSAEDVRLLVNGSESFPLRENLIQNAKESIDVMSWAIYDDLTGTQAVDLLLKKHQQGIKVRVIVDGQVASKEGYGQQVQRLEKNGIEVIRWMNNEKIYEGQHRKMIVIDSEHVIAGGLNFGDVYSHKNPNSQHWRDTDIYLRGGSASKEAQNLFAQVWNSQINKQNLSVQPMDIVNVNDVAGKKVMIIDSRPGEHVAGSPVMKTMLMAIRSAQHTIDIENAYVVTAAALRTELQSAMARGVKVRIFTNSDKSVDEPVVSIPILKSAKELAQMGAEVYLKKGDTLHSKIMNIDDQFSMVMSYNLHPRSERIEQEMAIAVMDSDFSGSMSRTIGQDLANLADKVNSADDIKINSDPQSLIGLRIFFDQL